MDSVARLSDAKRALLERRLRGMPKAPILDVIPPRPVGVDPLSFGQERLWLQQQISPNPSLFNIAFLAHIDGALDVDALEDCVNDVILRHETLRTGFVNVEGSPGQKILPELRIAIRRVDLRAAAERALGDLRRRAAIEAGAPFDLALPPLMRVTLFEIAQARCALLFVVHHIIWDGWSSGVFIDEIKSFYEAKRARVPAPIPALSTQYTDFAHWHRAFMASEAGRQQIDYWRARLAGLPELVSLPTDRPRAARQSHIGASHEWTMFASTREKLLVLAHRHGATQFTVLLAVYNVLLMHYSGQRDIAIGTAMACRTRPALERLVGLFANMLVMRTSLEDDPTFETLIRRTHQICVEAQTHQDVPFDMLVEQLQPKRSLSHNPLFQVAFVQHHLPIDELVISDLRINFENLNTAAAFDLVLHIYGEGLGLRAAFEYDSHLFDARTIKAMASHFDALLDDVLAAPHQQVSRSRLMDPRQAVSMLANSRSPLAMERDHRLLHEIIDTAKPEMTAVVCGDRRLSYSALEAQSNALAHRLRAAGVVPEEAVAILIEPSVELIIAIVGVLKAGGAYLPLDPGYPSKRIQAIVTDCAARTVITTTAQVHNWSFPNVATVLLDEANAAAPNSPPSPPRVLSDDNLAYLIYTSGSTGLSKGVMISHRAAVAATRARELFYPENVSAFLLLSSVSFDSSVAGIFWTLSQGGALHIPTEEERRDPAALARLINRAHISHLLCLPSLYSALLDVADGKRFGSLRSCIVAGEACLVDLAEKHFHTLPDVQLTNEYGPTECAVWSTAHILSSTDIARPAPIGRPIPGAQAVIAGSAGLQPQGAAGELCIGGLGLARGYKGRPDLTADRFRPNPFGAPGERLYRSGDTARLNADGDIEFLGRLDDQLKIRGYRVDPREIESVMLGRREIVECVVVGKPARNGAAQLIAYFRSTTSAIDEHDMRRHAAARLPVFMIPDRFIPVDEMPRLPNGKVNRSALPAPSALQAVDDGAPEKAGVVELLVADLWRDVLRVAEIRGGDNFFDLGGNSLAAMQVVARAQRVFGQEVPISVLFESTNLRDFATAIEHRVGPDFDSGIAALLTQIEAESVD